MPRFGSTLSNCYTPTPLPLSSSKSPSSLSSRLFKHSNAPSNNEISNIDQTRTDRSLRVLHLARSVLSSSSGSSLVEIGHTKVLCSVHGPRPASISSTPSTSSSGFQSGGLLNCEVRYAPGFGIRPETSVLQTPTNLDGYQGGLAHGGFAGGGGGGSGTDEETELSRRLHDAVCPSVPLHLYPKNVIDLYVMVLQNDGGVLGASVTAASLALADSGVELYDLVAACSVAVVVTGPLPPPSVVSPSSSPLGMGTEVVVAPVTDPRLLVDPTEDERNGAEGVVTLAMMPNWKEVTFWDQEGRLEETVAGDAGESARDGCTAVWKLMRSCLVNEQECL